MSATFDPNAAARFPGIYGLPTAPEQARVALLPVPWEATASARGGTAAGPAAIFAGSRQVDLFDHDTGRPYEAGIVMLPISEEVRSWSDEARRHARPVIEAGGADTDPALAAAVTIVDGLSARLNAWVHAEAVRQLDAGRLLGVVGGDHSAPLGAIAAVAERHPGLGILHLDAHADLRQAFEGFRFSHASIFHNVLSDLPGVARLVQVGLRDYCEAEAEWIRGNADRVRAYFDPDLRRQLYEGETFAHLAGRIVADLPREVYVSFDIDALDPSLCPNTGTPVPGGLGFAEVVALLRTLVESGRSIVGFDLCEVAPDPEGRSDWDGQVGARVLYKLIGFALLSQRG
jgi:agmatinase